MKLIPRRNFLKSAIVPLALPIAGHPLTWLHEAADQAPLPTVHFPTAPRDRIAIASS